MAIQVTCRDCRNTYTVDATPVQLELWRNGELIQNAMPNLSADDRELLMTRTCGNCFDAIFANAGIDDD